MTEECFVCNKNLEESNPKYVLKTLSMVGYISNLYCSKKCFITYLKKKFKLEKWE